MLSCTQALRVLKEGSSFFLQKADACFCPDVICKLPDGAILAVEYKCTDRWEAAKDDRLIGGLWEEMSNGRCRFVMVTNKEWERVQARL